MYTNILTNILAFSQNFEIFISLRRVLSLANMLILVLKHMDTITYWHVFVCSGHQAGVQATRPLPGHPESSNPEPRTQPTPRDSIHVKTQAYSSRIGSKVLERKYIIFRIVQSKSGANIV